MTSTYFWSYFQSIFPPTISISAFDVKTTAFEYIDLKYVVLLFPLCFLVSTILSKKKNNDITIHTKFCPLKEAFTGVNRFESPALMGSCISLKWSWKGRPVDAALRRIKRQLCIMNCNGYWERQEADVAGFLKGRMFQAQWGILWTGCTQGLIAHADSSADHQVALVSCSVK